MSILAVNSGSSSLKLSLFDGQATKLIRQGFELREVPAHEVTVIGHRFVHGGGRFRKPVVVDEQVWSGLKEICELAPLHNPAAMKVFEQTREMFPNARQVAVFDTAFFSDLSERAFIYPVPYEWFSEWGIRRYGFHGISHEYCSGCAGAARRLVICHLGSGCSASAIREGKPLTTSMGFTPMEGLMMATRSGSIDPGILLHVLKNRSLSMDALEAALNKSSGLLGVSGISSDYREIEKTAAGGNARARLALDMYTDTIVSIIGAYAALLGGLDAILFTGGVGEHQPALRRTVCERLGWMGVQLDAGANEKCVPDMDIATRDSRARILVIHTREDLMIARAARDVCGGR